MPGSLVGFGETSPRLTHRCPCPCPCPGFYLSYPLWPSFPGLYPSLSLSLITIRYLSSLLISAATARPKPTPLLNAESLLLSGAYVVPESPLPNSVGGSGMPHRFGQVPHCLPAHIVRWVELGYSSQELVSVATNLWGPVQKWPF